VTSKDTEDLLEIEEPLIEEDEKAVDPKEEAKDGRDKNPLSCRQQSEIGMTEVTAENMDKYTLEDVIFPILGHKVKMPSHPDMKAIVEAIMAEDGISMQTFES